ncbi:hypothetical protein L21SP2_2953 [Salinispira pacifica]|uniref:Uncharacterized protein n=1 Tax=Salinispira pacifica TaxID=1307761 RepID=V5WL60_9SPIO|nr:hypothetical protein L21SP2_2953 [Salinispira pacifica]
MDIYPLIRCLFFAGSIRGDEASSPAACIRVSASFWNRLR